MRDRAAVLLGSFAKPIDDAEQRFLLDEPLPMTFAAMERSVRAYMSHPHAASDSKPVTFSSLPVVEESYVPTALPAVRAGAAKKKAAAAAEGESGAEDTVDPAAAVYKVPELAALGRASHSSKETALTENEMEYVVSCVKHIFENHIVLQFTVLNTIDDQRLKDVIVNVDVSDSETYTVETVVPAPVGRYGDQCNCFVSLARNGDPTPATFPCELHFKVVQVDPSTGEVEGDEDGYEEEYPLEALELGTNDFMSKVFVGDFRRAWEEVGNAGEVLEKFALQFKKLEDAVTAVIDFLGMNPVDGTRTVPHGDGPKRTHTLHMCGKFVGNVTVLARAQLQTDDASGVVLKLAVRSDDKEVSQMVAECIH